MKLKLLSVALVVLSLSATVCFGQEDSNTTTESRFQSGVAATNTEARTRKALTNIEKAVSVLIPGGIVDGTPRKEKLTTIIEMFGRGQAQNALDALTKMAAEDPELPPAEVMMAGLTFAVGDNNSGLRLLEASAVKHPDYPGVYLSFAQLALNANRITDASLHADKTARLIESGSMSEQQKSHFLKQYYEIATGIYLRRNQNDKASETLEKLQAVAADLPFYFYSKAEIAYRGEQDDVALEFLKEHAAAIRSKRLPELTLVDWYRNSGKDVPAEKLLLETLAANPRDAGTQMMAAQMFMSKEQFSKALLSLKNFEEINGDATTNTLDMKGRIAFAGQSYDRAAKHFLNLRKRVPNDPSSLNIYALCLVESDEAEKRKQAQQISEQVASRMANNPLAIASLAYIYLKNGDKQRSQALMARVVTAGNSSPEISWFLANWLAENGQQQQAIEVLEKIVEAKGLFLYRSAARKLLSSLQGK